MRFGSKFKKGAASFYIVAFSTLILLIVVMSFAAIIISEIERTSNADLSQSAYDSALAGVEDAKLAFYNYQNCVSSGATASSSAPRTLDCSAILYYVENPLAEDCDMVGHILGRVGIGESAEVPVQESTIDVSNNMQQAYTCAKIKTVLKDYRSTLTSTNQIKVVRAKFNGVPSDKITKMKISWYQDEESDEFRYTNFAGGKVVYPQVGAISRAAPPTISVAMLQTAANFNLNDFTMTVGDRTDRGMLYLTPIGEATDAGKSVEGNYIGAYNGTENYIAKSGFLKSNDKTTTNLPYGVYCPKKANSDSEFACSATVELPKPVNGARNDDTFIFVVGLPYGAPDTDFAMEFFCDDECATDIVYSSDENGQTVATENKTKRVSLSNVQVEVDSTGRANDLYRRIETRLESGADNSYLSMMGPLELLGNSTGGDTGVLEKNFTVKQEYNFR